VRRGVRGGKRGEPLQEHVHNKPVGKAEQKTGCSKRGGLSFGQKTKQGGNKTKTQLGELGMELENFLMVGGLKSFEAKSQTEEDRTDRKFGCPLPNETPAGLKGEWTVEEIPSNGWRGPEWVSGEKTKARRRPRKVGPLPERV